MYKYTPKHAWFLRSEIKSKLFNHIEKFQQNRILEIGCFEGLSSVFFADNLLNHSKSSLVCVDPFLKIEDNDHKKLLVDNIENNFDYNIKNCQNSEKITVEKITSDEFFKINNKTYNFIYIDGCHKEDFIIRDMENSFGVLEKGGIMWMDDYRGGAVGNDTIKNAMDSVLKNHEGEYELIHEGYQLAIRKK